MWILKIVSTGWFCWPTPSKFGPGLIEIEEQKVGVWDYKRITYPFTYIGVTLAKETKLQFNITKTWEQVGRTHSQLEYTYGGQNHEVLKYVVF